MYYRDGATQGPIWTAARRSFQGIDRSPNSRYVSETNFLKTYVSSELVTYCTLSWGVTSLSDKVKRAAWSFAEDQRGSFP